MIKTTILLGCLLILGTIFAQETAFERPPPPIQKTVVPPLTEEEKALIPPPPALEVAPRMKTQDPDSIVVDFPEIESEYPGGPAAMKKFIQENVQYPEEDRENNVQGCVYVTFIVERDGSLSNIDFMRGGVSPSINREAGRLIRAMPNWVPAENGGKKVRSRCRLPITFILTSNSQLRKARKKKRSSRR